MSKTIKEYDRYLPISERGREWGIYVTGAGFGQVKPGGHYPRNGHPSSHEFAWKKGRILHEYQIIYIKEGEGRFQSNATGERTIEAGTVILLFPDVWHRYRPSRSTGWVEYWVGFAGKDAERLQARGFLSPDGPLLTTGSDAFIMHAFTTLLDRMRSEPVGFEQLIVASVWEVIAAVLGAAKGRETYSRHHDLVRRAKVVLEDQREGLPVVEDLAASLGLSPTRFQHLFKKHTGLSPYQYHLQLKIQRAREMLRGSNLTVKQVARMLKFESVYHFSTLFKKKTGLTPSQWRACGVEGSDPASMAGGFPADATE
jgi:AraC-like DNA-binding protein